MPYAVFLTASAQRELRKLPQDIQARIRRAIRVLADEARPRSVRKLEGREDLYRIGVGDYRIVYRITDDPPRVTVIAVRHRRDVYRSR